MHCSKRPAARHRSPERPGALPEPGAAPAFRVLRGLLAGGAVAAALLGAAAGRADELNVAVAANFRAPMEVLAPEFERLSGHRLVTAYGSTGKFYSQIHNGAPFDILLAADAKTPAQLEQEGLGLDGSRFTYAIGTLVLWSARPGFVDGHGDILAAPASGKPPAPAAFDRLALADPRLAPYGAAAFQVLTRLGRYEALRERIVQGEDINQTYQFVASGNAPLGFVALSQVYRDGALASGSAWIVPQEFYTPLRQDGVILEHGRGNAAAAAFMQFLRGAWARKRIAAFGYRVD